MLRKPPIRAQFLINSEKCGGQRQPRMSLERQCSPAQRTNWKAQSHDIWHSIRRYGPELPPAAAAIHCYGPELPPPAAAAAAGGELVCASSSFRSSAAVASANESPAIPNVRSMVGTAAPSGMLASPRSTGTTLSNHFDSSSSACTHPEAAAASFSDRLLRPQAMGIDNSAVRRVCR
jgi:hypothetical protein